MKVESRHRTREGRARAILLASLLGLAASAQAQLLPDDDPPLPNWRSRIARADSLRTLGRLHECIDLLEDLRGSQLLRERHEDYPRVLLGLARTYALAGDVDRAYERISEAFSLNQPVWRELAGADEFARVRSDPRFEELAARAQRHEEPWRRLWTPLPELGLWRDTLSLEMRAYGVSAIWSAARQSYAYFDRLRGIGWDSLYLATLRAVTDPISTLEYYRRLQAMVVQLGDGHTAVLPPTDLDDSIGYFPPIRTLLVDGRVVVTAVTAIDVVSVGVAVGDEVVSIDGMPVREYADRKVRPWVSASSERDRDHRTYEQFLLAGPAISAVRLGLKGSTGVLREVEVMRFWCWEELAAAPAIDFRRLDGNVGYIAINTFHDQYIVGLFDRALRRLLDSRALIIDLRGNTGGYSRLAFEILARLMPASFETHSWETPEYRGYFHAHGARGGWHREPAGCIPGAGAKAYARPVIVLIGPGTISAAENFAVAFDYARRGILVGDTTAGSTGHGLIVPLPAGGICRITTTRDYYPDGREYNGHGVAPQFVVARNADEIRSGEDRALEYALELLDTH